MAKHYQLDVLTFNDCVAPSKKLVTKVVELALNKYVDLARSRGFKFHGSPRATVTSKPNNQHQEMFDITIRALVIQ